jgi:polar amino acid transport system substrate-binding protein
MRTKLRRTTFLLTVLAAGALTAAPAAALTLLADENPPFNYTEKGKPAGAATEIVLGMASRANLPVRIDVLPWSKAYVRTQAERDTCLFSTARLENRERLFLWVGPIATNLWAVYGKGDFAPTIRSLKDLSPYRIGTVVRDPKVEFLRENGVNDVRQAREDAQNPARLLLPRENPERIDLWITDLYAGRFLAQAAKVTDVKLVFIAGEEPLFLACNPQTDRTVVKALADALDAMKADGSFKRITDDYDKRFAR